MSISNYDTFQGSQGTVLSSHTSNTGSTYVKSTAVGSNNLQLSYGGTGAPYSIRVSAGSSPGAFLSAAAPYSADYTVSAQIQEFTNQTGDQAGVLGRYSTSADSGYGAIGINGTGYYLFKHVAGAFTLLGSYGSTTNSGDTIALQMVGSTIAMLINGVPQVSVTDTTFSAAGAAGVYIFTPNGSPSDVTNLQIKWFCVSDQYRSSNYVACDGDSRQFSYYCSYGGGTAAGTSTPGQLLSLLGSGWTADNFGIPGYTLSQLNALASSRIDTTYSSSRTADVLICEAGFNDIFTPQAAGNTTAQALAVVQANYIAYWTARRAATPGRYLVGCGIAPCGTAATVVPSPSYWNTVISAFNSWLVTNNNWQQYTNALYLPGNDPRLSGNNATYSYSDEVHYVDAGYAALAQNLYPLSKLSGIVLTQSGSAGATIAMGIGL